MQFRRHWIDVCSLSHTLCLTSTETDFKLKSAKYFSNYCCNNITGTRKRPRRDGDSYCHTTYQIYAPHPPLSASFVQEDLEIQTYFKHTWWRGYRTSVTIISICTCSIYTHLYHLLPSPVWTKCIGRILPITRFRRRSLNHCIRLGTNPENKGINSDKGTYKDVNISLYPRSVNTPLVLAKPGGGRGGHYNHISSQQRRILHLYRCENYPTRA